MSNRLDEMSRGWTDTSLTAVYAPAEEQGDIAGEREAREAFLRECGARPAPPELYATWLWHYEGEVTCWREGDFPAGSSMGAEHGEQDCYWMLTGRSGPIPTTCKPLRLLVLGYKEEGPASASGDGHQGWEYGNATVMTLQWRADGGIVATTNNPFFVESFGDIEAQLSLFDANGGGVGAEGLQQTFGGPIPIQTGRHRA